MRRRLAAAFAGPLLFTTIAASAADKVTVQSLVGDGYTVVSAWMSNIGPGIILQKADKVFLCFVTERPELDRDRHQLLQASALRGGRELD